MHQCSQRPCSMAVRQRIKVGLITGNELYFLHCRHGHMCTPLLYPGCYLHPSCLSAPSPCQYLEWVHALVFVGARMQALHPLLWDDARLAWLAGSPMANILRERKAQVCLPWAAASIIIHQTYSAMMVPPSWHVDALKPSFCFATRSPTSCIIQTHGGH